MDSIMNINQIINLYKILGKENIEVDYSLKEYTGFKIGEKAHFMLMPTNVKMANKLFKFLNKFKLEYIVLGNATNVLITKSLDIVVSLKKLNTIKIKNNCVYCESGVSLFKLNEVLKDNNLSGLERLYGIPGSVGGGIVQNCGAYSANISDNLTSAIVFDGKRLKKIKKQNLEFGYRTSIFKRKTNYIVLAGNFKLEYKEKEKIEKTLNDILTLRKSKQPYEYPSAGSVFKRIDGIYISKLIDELGLKGKTIGGAKISEKHAGFIINYNNATSQDVLNLIHFVKNQVKCEKNIDLELEIVVI